MHALAARRIVTKPWGKIDVGVLLSDATTQLTARGQTIGEVWFEPEESDVLVKYLLTSERLSIQVHPDDEQARCMGALRGKEECWLILEAEPDAHYGIGFKREVSREELKAAALDGSIVDLMDWRSASVGDFIYNPSRTVHALGPGLTVLEIQQNSDVTLRLFDYFSARTLHVEQAAAIARLGLHHHPLDTHVDFDRSLILVDGPKFGLAFCKRRAPSLPTNATDFQLVTWKDAVTVGTDLVAPGSLARVQTPDEICADNDHSFFLVWSIGPLN
jgi:mannose-6-phosphate isomerase